MELKITWHCGILIWKAEPYCTLGIIAWSVIKTYNFWLLKCIIDTNKGFCVFLLIYLSPYAQGAAACDLVMTRDSVVRILHMLDVTLAWTLAVPNLHDILATTLPAGMW
jgi:hypothetical protein